MKQYKWLIIAVVAVVIIFAAILISNNSAKNASVGLSTSKASDFDFDDEGDQFLKKIIDKVKSINDDEVKKCVEDAMNIYKACKDNLEENGGTLENCQKNLGARVAKCFGVVGDDDGSFLLE